MAKLSYFPIQADAAHLPIRSESVDVILTSPTYGNRMADHHHAQDGSYRRTYTHSAAHPTKFSLSILNYMRRMIYQENMTGKMLDPFAGVGTIQAVANGIVGIELEYEWAAGRKRIPGKLRLENSGAMQWGDKYRALHLAVWRETTRVARQGAWFLLNCRNHIRKRVEQAVVEWHHKTIMELGWVLMLQESVATPGFRFGENTEERCPEQILIFRKRSF